MATTLLGDNEPARHESAASRLRRESRARAWRRTSLIIAVAAAASVTLLVAVAAFWRTSPVEAIGAGNSLGVVGASLRLPVAYTIFSPLCEAYDALTLLTLEQHGAVLGWLLAAFVALRVWRFLARRRAAIGGRRGWRGARREVLLLLAVILAFAAVYVAGAIVPRPMAAIALTDRDELAVDVHSHTSVSHDGRPGFDAAANRRWHEASGFAAAYVTDHRYYDGAVAGALANPRTAGEGTVLLPGIESVAPGSRVTILGARAAMKLDDDGRLDVARLADVPGVVVVLTTPATLTRIPALFPLNAVEVSDGAPRGLMFTRRLAPTISRFAHSRGLVAVAGSNNHGWGRTASAWTVLRIPGWRRLTPDSLDHAVRTTLLNRAGAVRVIARGSLAPARSVAALVATPAAVVWGVVRRLSPGERASWTVWAWLAAMATFFMQRTGGAGATGDDALRLEQSLPNVRTRRDGMRLRPGNRTAR